MISSMAMPSEGTFSLTQVNLRKCIFKFEKRGYLQIRSKPQEMLGELFHHLGILQGLWGDLKTGNVQLVIEGKFLVTFPLKHSFTRFATSTSMFSVGCDLCINQLTKYYLYLKAPKIFFFDKVLNPNLNFPTDVVYIKKHSEML